MKRLWFLINIMVLCFNTTYCQESAREIGLGGSMLTLSRGISSIGINPANLAYSRSEINIINFNSYLNNNLISLNIYNNLNGANLENKNSPLSKLEFLELMGGRSLDINLGINTQLPAINYLTNNYAFTTKLRQFVELNTGNGFIKMLFLGNEWETEIPLDIHFTSQSIMEYGYSSWKELNGFSIGYTIKYLQGISLIKFYTRQDSKPFITDSTGINLEFDLRRELYPGGSGYGIDLGLLTKESKSGWSFGLSIINLFGYINWDKHNLNYTLIGKSIMSSLGLNAYSTEVMKLKIENLNASDLMSGSIEIPDTVVSDTSYTTSLDFPMLKMDYPTMFRVGFSKNIKNEILFAYESRTGFHQESISPEKWIHSIGVEVIKWHHLPLRIGITSGAEYNHKLGFGFGVHYLPFNVDFGVSWTGNRKLYTATGIEFGFSITFIH
jgi:hypothetical protein